jgi:ribosomal protein L37AE/L43A
MSVTDRNGIEVPAELDGVDLLSAEECPNCGDSENAWIQNPAGYYTCPTCWSTWAGDAEDATIVDYVAHDDGRNCAHDGGGGGGE